MTKPILLIFSVLAVASSFCVYAQEDGTSIAERLQRLNADTTWRQVERIPVQFDTFHPQGMAVVGERLFISSVEVIDRRKSEGKGHLFECDMAGKLLRQIRLEEDAVYHPGGIDFDGRYLWVPVAEYRSDSRAVVFRVDPKSMNAVRVFEFADHLGGILRDGKSNALIANSWGSRRFYRWSMTEGAPSDPKSPMVRANPSHYVDYQDGQWLRGTNLMLCGGLRGYRVPGRGKGTFPLGGVGLIETDTLDVVHEIPIPIWTEGGGAMTQNPFYATATEEGLRFYFMPEDNESTIYVYEPVIR